MNKACREGGRSTLARTEKALEKEYHVDIKRSLSLSRSLGLSLAEINMKNRRKMKRGVHKL